MTPLNIFFLAHRQVHKGQNLLRGFLHSAVGVEGLQLVLHSAQTVGQLPVIQCQDGLLNPLQKVRGQRLILLYQLVSLDGMVQDLWREPASLRHPGKGLMAKRPAPLPRSMLV